MVTYCALPFTRFMLYSTYTIVNEKFKGHAIESFKSLVPTLYSTTSAVSCRQFDRHPAANRQY